MTLPHFLISYTDFWQDGAFSFLVFSSFLIITLAISYAKLKNIQISSNNVTGESYFLGSVVAFIAIFTVYTLIFSEVAFVDYLYYFFMLVTVLVVHSASTLVFILLYELVYPKFVKAFFVVLCLITCGALYFPATYFTVENYQHHQEVATKAAQKFKENINIFKEELKANKNIAVLNRLDKVLQIETPNLKTYFLIENNVIQKMEMNVKGQEIQVDFKDVPEVYLQEAHQELNKILSEVL